jgi:hypothetical protein
VRRPRLDQGDGAVGFKRGGPAGLCDNGPMADETNIRDFIGERFTRLDAKLGRVLGDIGELKVRMYSIEMRVTSLEASIVHLHARLDAMQASSVFGNRCADRSDHSRGAMRSTPALRTRNNPRSPFRVR